ncbi:MAG: ABC transporter ATP-binding protein [Phycisphaerae bacterium]
MSDNFIALEETSLRFRRFTARTHSLKESFVNTVLRRRYGGPVDEIVALDRVSLNIRDSERIGVVGDNGAGKSSMLKVIAGIYPPTAGRVLRRGFLVPLLEIGVWFNAELSGLENIYLTGAIMGFSRRQMQRRIDPVLDFAELREFADTPVKYYSTGMTQRLAFSVATEVDPEILLLDEVFSVGDIHWVEKARRRMQALIDRARILVLVSHQMEQIQQYCTRAIWLRGGKLIADGAPAEVVERYRANALPAESARPAPIVEAAM